MQRVFSLLVVSALVLAGCGEPNQFPRVDFPSAPGFYIQSYRDGSLTVVEIAKVTAGGSVTALTSSSWHGKQPAGNQIMGESAVFNECGVILTFRPGQNGQVMTTPLIHSHTNKRSCPLGDLPAVWAHVQPAKGSAQ